MAIATGANTLVSAHVRVTRSTTDYDPSWGRLTPIFFHSPSCSSSLETIPVLISALVSASQSSRETWTSIDSRASMKISTAILLFRHAGLDFKILRSRARWPRQLYASFTEHVSPRQEDLICLYVMA